MNFIDEEADRDTITLSSTQHIGSRLHSEIQVVLYSDDWVVQQGSIADHPRPYVCKEMSM